MSVLTPKRLFPYVIAVLLLSSNLFASSPSPRTNAVMAYDQAADVSVLFGGRVPPDAATGRAYSTNETWLFSAHRWIQIFPVQSPSDRSAQSMAYDSLRQRIVLFGGRQEAAATEDLPILLNDTWSFKDGAWTQLAPGTSPEGRVGPAMAYDPVRDRMVLFGGEAFLNAKGDVKTLRDTWEFDGSTWVKVPANEPAISRGLLTWDAARGEMLLVGAASDGATKMYRFRPSESNWAEITPAKLPPCVTEGIMTWRSRTQTVFLLTGVCTTDNSGTAESWQWNGTDWTKTGATDPSRATGMAYSYDTRRDSVAVFGGITLFTSTPRSSTYLFDDGAWRLSFEERSPAARSLATMQTNAAGNHLWLYGGLDERSDFFLDEFWRYENGQWSPIYNSGTPAGCVNPLSTLDTDRNVLVLVCEGTEVSEWNGTEWKDANPSKQPGPRRFATMVYDPNLKKTILFGGFDPSSRNYKNDTWTWDGTNWTEVRDSRPTHRGQHMMWYDPLQKKTIIYGGIGRPSLEQKATVYEDMWSFTGSGWTKMTVASTPGPRIGAQHAIDPRTGKLLLIGGLRAVIEDGKRAAQFYDNDMWVWDGAASSWSKLEPTRRPPARENGVLAFDPTSHTMLLFGGYFGGFYLSDAWHWDGQSWTPLQETSGRRRAARRAF